jgi:hypothetical protein
MNRALAWIFIAAGGIGLLAARSMSGAPSTSGGCPEGQPYLCGVSAVDVGGLLGLALEAVSIVCLLIGGVLLLVDLSRKRRGGR